jgi:hypothetical protein
MLAASTTHASAEVRSTAPTMSRLCRIRWYGTLSCVATMKMLAAANGRFT